MRQSPHKVLSAGLILSAFLLLTRSAHGERPMLQHAPEVPPNVDFVRSFDVDLWAERTNYGPGAQSGRMRLRYLDPDVNALVGMVAGVNHFNDDVLIGEGETMNRAAYLVNWGAVFGLVRGRHLWELDVMGANMSSRLGFAAALVGEHQLAKRLLLYHRTELNIFSNDTILDADQGFYWMWRPSLGLSLGYRWFTSMHSDRSGPHVGFRLYFQSPKIPFIFPSLG